MSLSHKATAASDAVRDAAQNSAMQKLRASATVAQQKLERALEYLPDVTGPAIYLSSLEGKHPVRQTERYGGTYISRKNHEVHRFQLDDLVVVRIHASYGTTSGTQWRVERPCARCGQPGYAGPTGYSNGAYDFNDAIDSLGKRATDQYARRDPTDYEIENCPRKFITAIGTLLRTAHLCWDCEAEVGDDCPTCHRSWTVATVRNA